MDYSNGTVTVTTTRSSITVTATNGGLLLTNQGTGTVYLGGPTVTADKTATGGYPLLAAGSVTVPTVGDGSHTLYLVTATGSASVTFIQPLLS